LQRRRKIYLENDIMRKLPWNRCVQVPRRGTTVSSRHSWRFQKRLGSG
jgi:hypothetical protein